MIGLIIKSLLTLSSLFFTIYLFYSGSWGWAIVFIFITAFIGIFLFRNENLILAALQMRQQNMEKAQKYLNRIKQPQFLMKGQQAYFYYLKAIASSQILKTGQVESLFRKALSIGLKGS